MSYIHPAWVAHQRARWLRPDWQRWMRPDAHRFAPPGVLQTKSYAARLIEQRNADEEAARAARREALIDEMLAIRRQLAEVKVDLAWRRLRFKANFNSKQPRRPKGDPEGPGEWVKEGGGRGSGITTPAAMPREGQGIDGRVGRRGGHHYVSRAVFGKRRLSADTRKVFEDTTTGRLDDKKLNVFDQSHRAYNKGVDQLVDQFLAKNGVTEEQMTPDHARQILSEVITSRDP